MSVAVRRGGVSLMEVWLYMVLIENNLKQRYLSGTNKISDPVFILYIVFNPIQNDEEWNFLNFISSFTSHNGNIKTPSEQRRWIYVQSKLEFDCKIHYLTTRKRFEIMDLEPWKSLFIF